MLATKMDLTVVTLMIGCLNVCFVPKSQVKGLLAALIWDGFILFALI